MSDSDFKFNRLWEAAGSDAIPQGEPQLSSDEYAFAEELVTTMSTLFKAVFGKEEPQLSFDECAFAEEILTTMTTLFKAGFGKEALNILKVTATIAPLYQDAVNPPEPTSAQTKLENEFYPDWDAMSVMVEEQQRMAKRIEELEKLLREKNG